MASVNPADRKTQISKHLAQMSFMKRAKQKEEKQEQEATEKRAIDDEHWVLDIPDLARKESHFINEPGYAICAQLLFGRGSFHGFNPEIEKLYVQKISEMKENAKEKVDETIEDSIDDNEMAERYSSLVGTLAKKMTKKRNRSKVVDELEISSEEIESHKRTKKFIKPSDD